MLAHVEDSKFLSPLNWVKESRRKEFEVSWRMADSARTQMNEITTLVQNSIEASNEVLGNEQMRIG